VSNQLIDQLPRW